MAQRVTVEGKSIVVVSLCDFCYEDTESVETLSFGLDGAAYELDVCDQHADECRDSMATMVGMSRRAGSTSTRPSTMPALRPVCERCGQHMPVPDRWQGGGRTKRYCSTSCRVAAHRARPAPWAADTIHAAAGTETA